MAAHLPHQWQLRVSANTSDMPDSRGNTLRALARSSYMAASTRDMNPSMKSRRVSFLQADQQQGQCRGRQTQVTLADGPASRRRPSAQSLFMSASSAPPNAVSGLDPSKEDGRVQGVGSLDTALTLPHPVRCSSPLQGARKPKAGGTNTMRSPSGRVSRSARPPC